MRISSKCFSLLLLGFSCALAAALAATPPAGVCVTHAGVYIQGWWCEAARWLFWPAEIALLAFGFFLFRFAGRHLCDGRLGALAPLAWLPALVALPHGLVPVDHTLAGIVLPLGGTFLAAICVERFLGAFPVRRDEPPRRRSALAAWAWFGAAFLLLLAYHFGVARPQGFGSGDVKHYRIQVQNLLERGDLDLTDRAESMMREAGIPDDSVARNGWVRQSHMRENEDGQIYSYHSFGFPLLACPFAAAMGDLGDGLLLALLGAMALCGVRSACLAHGAPRGAADAVSVLTGFSYVWVYTAMSYLPEMLGFGLVAWAFWGIAAQGEPGRRWSAAAVAALACSYLPVAHIRFTPTAGMLALGFGIEGLCLRGEPFWKGKVPRLGLFSLVCFGSWVLLGVLHARMFRGTAAYDYSDIAGHTPIVMWAIFADRRGVVSVVSAVSAFLVAAVAALFRRDAVARRAAMALAVVAATLWFCCCTIDALNGECLHGRYFYPMVPVLVPFFAIALSRATRPGRIWLLFLALVPVLYFLFVPWFLNGSGLVHAPASARKLMNLNLLWEPFPPFFHGSVPSSGHYRLVGSFFAASLFGLSALACTRRGPAWARTGAAVFLLAVAFVCGRAVNLGIPPGRIGPFEVLMANRHFHDFRVLGPHSGDFFASFRRPVDDARFAYVLTDDLSRTPNDACRLEHPSDLPATDWRQRPLRWGKVHIRLLPLCEAGGIVTCRATGRVVRGTARLALQVGGVPDAEDVVLEEGPFDVVFRTPIRRNTKGVNFQVALENDIGEVCVATTEYVPCPDGLVDLLGGFPASSTVVEADYTRYLR